MQFGRFHGIALLALGAILLLVQVFVTFNEKALPQKRRASSPKPAEGRPRGTLPGLEYCPGMHRRRVSRRRSLCAGAD
jgi:hypothetical protein